MSAIRIAGFAAASLMVGAIGFAQSSDQTSSDTNIAKADMTTVVGCLMKESDYRAAHGFGKGAFGGAGIGDEYVLVDAAMMPNDTASPSSTNDAPAPAASSASASASRSAACSESGNGLAFRPTGFREHGMEPLVGQRVMVTGKLEHAGREANSREGKLPEEIKVSRFGLAPAVSQQAAAAPEPAAVAAPQVEAQNNAQPPAPENPPAASAGEQPVGTSGNLPKTAGDSPLIGLIGLLLLGAGMSLTLLRRTAAAKI